MKPLWWNSFKLKHLVFLAVIGILPVLWFKQDYINGGDFAFPMAPTNNILINYYHVWTDKWGLGLHNVRSIPQLPFIALLTLGGKIGISTAVAERVLFYLLFTTSGISIYFLTTLLPFEEHKRIIAFFTSLFYMFNPLNIIFYWHILDGMIFVYSVLPLLLVSYLQWFRTKKAVYAFFFVITSFLGGYTFSNPLIIPILWFLLLSFTLLIIDSRKEMIHALKFYFKAAIIWSLFNGWWLVPLFYGARDEYAGLGTTIGSPWDTLNAFSKTNSFLNLFRLSDLYWAFKDNFLGTPFYSYAVVYNSVPFIVMSFVLPIVIFSPLVKLILRRKIPVFILFFYVLTLFYLFLAKGSYQPLGRELYGFLFKLPFFSAFRAPIHKLGVLISINYAILFGYGIAFIYSNTCRRNKKLSIAIIGSVMIIVLVIYPFPLWTGEVIHKGGKIYPSYHVKVPAYYYDAAEWLERDPDYFRFYSLPQSPTFNVAYDWEHGYIGSDPSFNIFSKPGVYSTVNKMAQLPYTILRDTGSKDVHKIFRLQGVKYIILHKDVNEKLWDIFTGRYKSVDYLERALSLQKNLQFVKEFGKLKFYKISDAQFLPLIYAASVPILIFSDEDSLAFLTQTPYMDNYPAIFFVNQQVNSKLLSIIDDQKFFKKREILFIGNGKSKVEVVEILPANNGSLTTTNPKAPTIEFKKISPTKYIVDVKDGKGMFTLIFSENFHNGWKAYMRPVQSSKFKVQSDESWSALWSPWKDIGNRIEIKDHFEVNGYANGWIVPIEQMLEVRGKRLEGETIPEDFQIVLEFKPQRLFEIGLLVSAITLLGCVGYLGYDFSRRRKNKRFD